MSFDHENKGEAAQKLESVGQSSAKSVGKMKPKIMICSVRQEKIKEEIKETILDRS